MSLAVLDPLEWKVLGALHLDARKSTSELATAFRSREHMVRYRIERLKEAGILRTHPLIDTYKFGMGQHDVFISLASPSADRVTELLNYLKASERIPWIGTFAGAYQYGFTICSQSPSELRIFLDQLSSQFGEIIFSKAIAYRDSYTELSFDIAKKSRQRSRLSFGVPGSVRLDVLDHRLLLAITDEPESSLRDLAKLVGISAPAIQQRLARLKQEGVLLGFNSIIDFSKLGLVPFTLMIELKSASLDVRSRLRAFAESTPEVHFLVESMGAFDAKLGLLFKDAERVNEVIHRIHEGFNKEIAKVQTLSAFRYLKVRRYPFMESPLSALRI